VGAEAGRTMRKPPVYRCHAVPGSPLVRAGKGIQCLHFNLRVGRCPCSRPQAPRLFSTSPWHGAWLSQEDQVTETDKSICQEAAWRKNLSTGSA
jgi:hypothetical protein